MASGGVATGAALAMAGRGVALGDLLTYATTLDEQWLIPAGTAVAVLREVIEPFAHAHPGLGVRDVLGWVIVCAQQALSRGAAAAVADWAAVGLASGDWLFAAAGGGAAETVQVRRQPDAVERALTLVGLRGARLPVGAVSA